MSSIKEQLKGELDETADQQTMDCLDSLTEEEAIKLKSDIEKSLKLIDESIFSITIKELRKTETTMMHKILCKTEIKAFVPL